MGLFDNIFLDEDGAAATAIAEQPVDTAIAELSPAALPPEGQSFDAMMGPEAAPQGTEITIAPETASTGNPDVSFDIGGDLNFSGIESPTEATAEAAPEEATAAAEPTSFTVNGVTYNADGTPVSDESAASIAMIQGSTAATGINIIDETSPNAIEGREEAIVETPVVEAPQSESSSIMDMISIGGEESATEPVTETLETPEEVAQISEAESAIVPETLDMPAISDFSLVDPIDILTESVAPVAETLPDTIEDTTTPIESKAKNVDSSEPDITTILNGFISELNDREQGISNIIMKRHELARRRMELEDDHKTRMLALNMEDEFLKSKAERERSEQDKLQHVIKNFQKQITMSE